VNDASRCPGVVERLMNPASRDAMAAETRESQESLRERYLSGQDKRPLLSPQEAQELAAPFGDHVPERPAFTGVAPLDLSVGALVPYIDWTPFFSTWEIRGTADSLLGGDVDPRVAELKRDADAMLGRLESEGRVSVRGACGFFAAARDGDDVVLFGSETRDQEVARFTFPRRLVPPRKDPVPGACPSLADWIAPAGGAPDWLGMFLVTADLDQAWLERLAEDHDDYTSIMAKALADRLAEASAEKAHEHMRRSWYAPHESLSPQELIRCAYRGIRPAPGYPACPDHGYKRGLFSLLGADDLGVTLTETAAMLPASSVCGFVFGHPESRYFSVGSPS